MTKKRVAEARSQLGTSGVAKNCLRGAYIFLNSVQ